MNWEAVNAVGQLVAALAVVASLLYLANQVRAHNRETRIAAMHELSEAFRASILSFQDHSNADLWARAKREFETLPEVERLRFIAMIQGLFRVWEDAYYQYAEGRLDDRVWGAMVAQFSGYLSLPGVVRVWEIRKMAYAEDFRTFVDGVEPKEYVTGGTD